MNAIQDIRPSPIAGRWYSADPLKLGKAIDGYLEDARLPVLDGQVIGLIAPHAGHIYSGPVAAYAFKTVTGMKPDLVAILSPLHQFHPHSLVTSAHQAYATPLGTIAIDRTAVQAVDQALRSEMGIGLSPVSFDNEHSLEIELPFLQRTLSGPFKLLPIMIADQSPEVARAVGRSLAKTLEGRSALIIASSDLSHFYSQDEARRLDTAILDQITNFSPEGLFVVEEERRGYACGLAPMAAVMWACKESGADMARVLHYATSGDVTGDFSSVVGYGAAVILKTRT